MSTTSFTIIVNLAAIIVVGIVCYMLFVSISEAEHKECQEAAPEKYETTSHYFLYGTLNCGYETLPKYEYDYCVKHFSKTENHGKRLTMSTCPGGFK